MTNANTVAAGAETPAALSNDKRKADFMKQVGKFGEESALGRDALPKLAHAVVKAVADGILDINEKDDKGNDAAALVYEKYVSQETKKALHERSAAGKKANISKLRQLMQFGAMTTIDPVEQMQKAFDARENMIADDNKVKPAYPFYVDMARKQLGQTAP
jgi:endo-alpha-1,4-polygalactosaminidase (GH114 family)